MTDTDHLRELDKAATPAPWQPLHSGYIFGGNGYFVGDLSGGEAIPEQQARDAALIAETRNSLSALLDELDGLRAVAEAARQLVAAEDRWMAEIDPEVGPPSIEPLVAALARLDQQGGEK